jgi:zinc protease
MLDRTIQPPFVRSNSFDLHKPELVVLPNGVQTYFIAGGNQDVIKIEIVINAGRWIEKAWGAAYFTSQLLSKGTSTKTSFEIAETFEGYGSHLEISPGLDFVSISVYSLASKVEPTFRLLLELLTDAQLPQKELEQVKSIYLQNLKVNNEKTSFLASKLFRKNLFGEEHPYGKELDEADVENLSRSSLLEHLNTFSENISVFVAGKISTETKRLLIDGLSNLRHNGVTRKQGTFADVKPLNQRQEKNGSVQSSVRLGKKSLLRSHPDYVNVLFLSHILGGYFGSRLMKNIREEKGLTYGIHASLHALKNDSYLAIGADVNKENVDLTIDEISKELRRLREEKIDKNELETARNHFIGGLQSELTTAFAHADKIKTIRLFGLSDLHYNSMIERIEKLTAEDLIRTGETYFNESSFLQIAVG